MATTQETALLHRDGTGQNDRFAPALRPEHFQADEHSLADWLRFARQLGQQLRYFDFAGRENGDWSAFAGADDAPVSVEDIVAFFNDPEAFFKTADADKARWLSRPHFALFLAFLDLLRLQQVEINRFTGRHLDFYYRQILGIQPKAPVPDRVFALLDLARGVGRHTVEAGALLQAGKNAAGRTRFFRTENEITVNRTRVGELRVFFQEKGHQSFEALLMEASNISNGLFIRTALGNPNQMPARPDGLNGHLDDDFYKNNCLLLLEFPEKYLRLSLGELRRFIAVRNKIEAHWAYFEAPNGINKLLPQASNTFPNFWDFETNFGAATGSPPYPYPHPSEDELSADHPFRRHFEGDIRNVRHLYERILDLGYTGLSGALSAELTTIQTLLLNHLRFPNIHVFVQIMDAFEKVQTDWKRLNAWVKKARPAENTDLLKNWQTRANDANLRLTEAAVGGASAFAASNTGFSDTGNAVLLWGKILLLEQHFQLPAEDILFLLRTWNAGVVPPPEKRRRLVEILTQAQQKAVLRREAAWLSGQARFRFPTNVPAMFLELFGLPTAVGGLALPEFKGSGNPDKVLPDLRQALAQGEAEAEEYVRKRFFMLPADFTDLVGTWQRGNAATEPEREELYQTVAASIRRKQNRPLRPGLETPRGFFAAPDAQLLLSGRAGEPNPRWRTFGWQRPTEKAKDKPFFQDAEIGFAIQSPLLALAEGERRVILKITFASLAEGDVWPSGMVNLFQTAFDYRFSNEKEAAGIPGVFPDPPNALQWGWAEGTRTLTAVLRLAADQPAVTAPHTDFFRSRNTAPVLKISLRQSSAGENKYLEISRFQVKNVTLSVETDGLLPAAAWNDDGEINPKKPFLPFGIHPRVGSRLSFRHTEILSKTLASVALNLVWMNRPASFATHYAAYSTSPPNQFQVRLNGGTTSHNLFPASGSAAEHTISVSSNMGNPPDGWFLQLQTPDFQHDKYLELLSGALTVTSSTTSDSPSTTTTNISARPNPPYTPRLKSFSLDYRSTEISLNEHFYHLLPFGHTPPEQTGDIFPLLPPRPFEAELYIGLEEVETPQHLSLLFQMAEGTADPEAPVRPLRWQYLAADGWRPRLGDAQAPPFVLFDGTDGLNRSGIVRLSLPAEVSDQNPVLPSGRVWLRVALDHFRQSVCDTIAIHTQAVEAVRVLETSNLETDDPGQPLMPGQVKGFSPRRPEIKAVQQPYSSFGGRSAEAVQDFYVRVSERLRHKQRAIALWDVERLVLEIFPDVYKAKCLPTGWQPAAMPGTVDVVLLPNLRGRLPMDPFQPRFPQARLAEIGDWLTAHGPQVAIFRVRNARFLRLKVEATVQFHSNYDPGYYSRELSDELARYLSPWAFDTASDIRFGGMVFPGEVLWFIESRPYVDFVTDLKLRRSDRPNAAPTNGQPLETDAPDEVWVSEPEHNIRLYSDVILPTRPAVRGIGFWQLEDFRIG